MSEFERWFKSLNEDGRVTYFLGQEGKVSKEAWDYQQSKIDELEKNLKNSFKTIEIEQRFKGELEGRIEVLESTLIKIEGNLDFGDCECCHANWVEIEKVLPEALQGEHDSLDVAQNTVNTTETPYAGQRIKVDFISESSTEFSGKRFCGEGVIDRLEDGFIFGRLDSGAPFLCLPSDIEVLT